MKIRKACSHLLLCMLCVITLFSLVKSEYDFYDDIVNNPYRELRLPPWSTMSQIKKRYNELVKIYHPDKTKSRNSSEKFRAIQEAYERIKDRRKAAEREEANDDSDNLNFESEEINSFFDAVADVVKILLTIGVFLSLVQFLSWICYKFYAMLYPPFFSLVCSFVICDRLFPHFFKSPENQILYSIVFGIVIYFSKNILSKFFAKFLTRKVVPSKDKKQN